MNRRTFTGVAESSTPAATGIEPEIVWFPKLDQSEAITDTTACPTNQARQSLIHMRALIVDNELRHQSDYGEAARNLVAELQNHAVTVFEATNAVDAMALIASQPAIECLLIHWQPPDDPTVPLQVMQAARKANPDLPVFLMTDQKLVAGKPLDATGISAGLIALLGDSSGAVSRCIMAAMLRYRVGVLPPMFRALVDFAETHKDSWHTPGHTGGTAFLKSPAGRAYHEFFGESLLRSDVSVSVSELGSLLDHSGPIGAGERNAARIFGAHRTYYVTNGSSTSNRIILMASVTRGQVTLCDRNCHKSVEHSVTMSGAIPTYLVPSRNGYGIIGPILPQRLTAEAIRQAINANPLVSAEMDRTPKHAVITNSTYDGLCYNVVRVEELLGASVDRLHFDEAWYGYAHFNPLYRDRHAMRGDAGDHDATQPTVFATQSTHKLLAALSQASMIHVRDGRRPIAHERFNESFMMHASTSPLYPLLASMDVSAAMMDGEGGATLTSESIAEAVDFRQMLARLHAEYTAQNDWFFAAWQPDTIIGADGEATAFYAAQAAWLTCEPSAWVLRPNAAWHGFGDIEDDYCMLDPIKVSVLTPGCSSNGELAARGIPAAVVGSFLVAQGIVPEKTTDFTILFLFSLGITKDKWGTLINALHDFKHHYDANTPLSGVLPSLAETYGGRVAGMGLADLCDAIFAAMKELETTATMAAAFSSLPQVELSPLQAYERLVRNEVEFCTLDQMAGRIAATAVAPYPHGIPVLMRGENAGPADGPILRYLKALEAFDRRFPGFTHETHGVEVDDGVYRVLCLQSQTATR